jgi:hypothetical protein
MAAVGAEKLDLFMTKFLIMAIEFALALRAGHPENFGHKATPPDLSSPATARDRRKISPCGRNDKRFSLRAFAALREMTFFRMRILSPAKTPSSQSLEFWIVII